MNPRCIATPNGTRCWGVASDDGKCLCPEHTRMITRELIDVYSTAKARTLLSQTPWETIEQAQSLLDRISEGVQ